MSWIKRFQRRVQLGKVSSPRQIFIAIDVARFIQRLTTSSTSTLAVWSNSHFLQILSTKIQSNCVEKMSRNGRAESPDCPPLYPSDFTIPLFPRPFAIFSLPLRFLLHFFEKCSDIPVVTSRSFSDLAHVFRILVLVLTAFDAETYASFCPPRFCSALSVAYDDTIALSFSKFSPNLIQHHRHLLLFHFLWAFL